MRKYGALMLALTGILLLASCGRKGAEESTQEVLVLEAEVIPLKADQESEAEKVSDMKAPQAVVQEAYGVTLLLDPRLELVSVIEYLSQTYDEQMTAMESDYKNEVEEWFAPCAEHDAVKQFGQLAEEISFIHDKPVNFALCLTEEYQLLPDTGLFEEVFEPQERKLLEDFAQNLAKFAKDSNFAEFYKQHLQVYEEWVSQTAGAIGEKDLAALREYVGSEQKGYRLYLTPLLENRFFGGVLAEENGQRDVFMTISPSEEGIFIEEAEAQEKIWYLFGYLEISLISNEYKDLLADYEREYKESLEYEEIYGLQKYLNDCLHHALLLRLELLVNGEAVLKTELSAGTYRVSHMNLMEQLLAYYEEDREQYPDLTDYFPVLAEEFCRELEADPQLIERVKNYLSDHAAVIDLNEELRGSEFGSMEGYQVFLAGESHTMAKSYDAKKMLIRYFHEELGVDHILCEVGFGSGILLDQYIQTGDGELLKFYMDQLNGALYYSKEEARFWQWLYAYNEKQEEDRKLHVTGLDVEHQTATAAKGLSLLAEEERIPADCIAPLAEKLKNEDAAYDKLYIEIIAAIQDHPQECREFFGENSGRWQSSSAVMRNIPGCIQG